MSFQVLEVVGPIQCGSFMAATSHPAKAKPSSGSLKFHQPIPIVIDIVVLIVTLQLRIQRWPDVSIGVVRFSRNHSFMAATF